MATAETITPAKRFWRLLKPDQKEIGNLYLYSIFNGLVYLSLPLGIQAIINLMHGGQISTSWVVLVVLVLCGITASGALQIYQLKITEMLQQKILTRAAFEFTYRLPRIKPLMLEHQNASELMNRFFETVSVQKGLSKLLLDFSTAIVQMAFGLLVLMLYHPFFIVFSLIILVAMWGIFKYSYHQGLNSSLRESTYKYRIAHWLEEIARNTRSLRMATQSDITMHRTNQEVTQYLDARETHFSVLLRQYRLMVLFKVVIAAGLLIIGGLLVLNQQMNLGQFVASEIIILLIMSSAEKVILNMEVVYDVFASLEKMGHVTDLTLEKNGGIKPSEILTDQTFTLGLAEVSYEDPFSKERLSQLDFTVKSGETVVISTRDDRQIQLFTDLLTGIRQPSGGCITINSIPLQNLDISLYRSQVAYLNSFEHLLDVTLLENISLGRNDITLQEITAWTAKLGLKAFIESLPAGYEQLLPTEDHQLPRNVRQKLLIARNLVHKPSLIVVGDIFHAFTEDEKSGIIELLTTLPHKPALIFLTAEKKAAESADKKFALLGGSLQKIQ